MLAIVYLVIGLIPPLVAGPMAGIIFINMLKRGKYWLLIPFWLALIIVNLLGMFWVVSSPGIWLPITSVTTFLFTPISVVITILLMRKSWRRRVDDTKISPIRTRWFISGMLGIPALQTLMFVALFIYAPWICKVGLVICQSS